MPRWRIIFESCHFCKCFYDMVNKCCAFGCKTGYDSSSHEEERFSTFYFPLEKENLLEQWVKFVNRSDWKPTKSSVLCIKHFDEKYISRGKRNKLNWKLDPVPTIHSKEALKRPSALPTSTVPRKAPKIRGIQCDQIEGFSNKDKIKSFSDIDESFHLTGFHCNRNKDCIVFYKLCFDPVTQFPTILEAIKVDKELHVQLQLKGCFVPLPQWFRQGHNAKLTSFSMLENFPSYLRSVSEDQQNFLLEELLSRQHYKYKGQPYSPEMIRYALLIRHTSAQAYRLLLECFPLPSISLLEKLQKGGINSIKAAKILHEKGYIYTYILFCKGQRC